MTTVYLCIGTQKTGTTFLQRFMAFNEEALHKQGYCYPRLESLGFNSTYKYRNGHFLAFLSRDESRERDYKEEEEKREEAYKLLAQIAKEYPNIVLSDEIIWYQSRKYKRFWQDLVEQFRKINCEVKVVVYLRRQDQVLQSLWNQRVKKMPCITDDFDSWMKGKKYKWFPVDYYAHLEKISQFVGKENLFVRVFERGQFEGEDNSLLSDYLQTIGVELTDDFEFREDEANFALSGNFIELKRMINGMPEYLELDNFMWNEMVAASVYRASQPDSSKSNMLSYEEQISFMQQFEESNRKVAQEFLDRKDGVLFREPIRNLPKWKVNEDTMYRDMMAFLVEMFCKYEMELSDLNTRIEVLEKRAGVGSMANKGNLVSRGYRKVKRMLRNEASQ